MTIRELKRLGGSALAGLLLGWTTSGDAWAQAPIVQNGPMTTSPASVVGPQRNYLNKRTIQLPIRIDDPTQRQTIKEIHLYVKEQSTAPWTLRDKASPLQGAFNFQAPADGEYAFTMVTVDRQGRAYPPDVRSEPPGLIVVIDTQAPTVEVLNLGTSPDGQLIQCDINDPNLDATRLRFAYQGGDKNFRPLEPMPGRPSVFCIPAQVVHTGLIQVTAEDLAGNQTSRQEQLRSMKTPPVKTVQATQPKTPNFEISTPSIDIKPAPSVNEKRPVESEPRPLPMELRGGGPGIETSIPQKQLPMPTENSKPAPLLLPTEFSKPAPLPSRSVSMRPDGSQGPHWSNEKPSMPFKATDRVEPISPVVLRQENGPSIINDATLQQPTAPVKSPAGTVMSNTRISLDYQIENAAQGSIAVVEVWLTRDQGRSWQKHAEVPGNRSPIEFQLPGEGLFGLTLVARNGKAAVSPPAPGDTPDSWVEVDSTRPTAQLVDVHTNFDRGQANVQIRWSAQDKNFGPGPVELQYAASPQGPWILIAKGLPAQGQHRWTPPSGIGSHVHVQLIATDAAGNRAVCGTAEPIAIGAPIPPRAIIRAISTGATNSPRVVSPQ
ncbi:MAG TPA: hypothetical protein VFE62_20625 [Gemmataceae bacterium]|nr:hypothetical protein [Gemmataceae bacterium]